MSVERFDLLGGGTKLVVRAAGDQSGLAGESLSLDISDTHTLVLSHSLDAEIEKALH